MKKLIYVLNLVDERDSQHFVHVLRLMAAMRDLGWSVVILSEKGGVGTRYLMGCEVRYLSRNGEGYRLIRQIVEMARLRRDGYRFIFVRITRPAALITALIGGLLGMTRLYWLSGAVLDLDDRKSPLRRFLRRYQLKFIINRMTALVTGPESMVSYYYENLGLSRGKIRLLYNDIDTTVFPATLLRERGQEIRLLMIHRLSPVRQTDLYFPTILDAMDELTRAGMLVVLDVVGDGPERPILEAMLANRGRMEVIFHGSVPNIELNIFYDRATIFLMPSYREGFPRVLVEAMSKGLPIVSTDAGGVRDILGAQQAEYVSARDDPYQFGKNIVRLAYDKSAREQLRNDNLTRVQRYATPRIAEMLEAMLLEVSTSRSR